MIYAYPVRLLHWIMAAGFAFMWLCGFTMTTLVEVDSPIEELLFDLHISVGVTLLGLLALRLAVRLTYPPPPLPEGLMSRCWPRSSISGGTTTTFSAA